MSKIPPLRGIVFGDVHASTVPPQSRTGEYMSQIKGKLQQVAGYVDVFKPHFRACTGDIFHRKHRSNAGDILECSEMLEPLKPIDTVPGNHDGFRSQIHTNSAFGVLHQTGIIRDVEISPRIIRVSPDAAYVVAGIGWRGSLTDTCFTRLRIDIENLLDTENDTWTPADNLAGVVILTHADETPIRLAELAAEMLVKWKAHVPIAIFNGHIHGKHGVHPITSHGFPITVTMTGSLTRTSRAEADQVPCAWSLLMQPSGAGIKVKCLPLQTVPPSEAFVDEDRDVSVNDDLVRFSQLLKADEDEDVFNPVAAVQAMGEAGGFAPDSGPVREAVRILRESAP